MSAGEKALPLRLKFLMTHDIEPNGELYARIGDVNKPVRAQGVEYVAATDYDALAARENVLREAFVLVMGDKLYEEEIGWRGTASNKDIFACEHCKAEHEDFTLIPHSDGCLVMKLRAIRAAIAKAEGVVK